MSGMAKARVHKPKSSNAVVNERVDAVRSLVNQGQTKGAIKAFCVEQFGVHWQTAEAYYSRAREEMLKDAGTDRQTLLAESKAFWAEMTIKDDATNADKMRARENLDKLFALSQLSVKVEHSGNIEHGGNITLTLAERSEIARLDAAIAEALNARAETES